jgi:hypothetical protein
MNQIDPEEDRRQRYILEQRDMIMRQMVERERMMLEN